MTQDEIIRMAREAGFSFETGQDLRDNIPALERFAALVAAHERETTGKVSLKYMNQQVLAEREACAKVCEDDMGWLDNGGGELCAKAIRNRGAK